MNRAVRIGLAAAILFVSAAARGQSTRSASVADGHPSDEGASFALEAAPQTAPAISPAASPAAESGLSTGPASSPATGPTRDEGEAVSFSGMGMEQVANYLSEKLGKPVLVSDSVKSKQITVISKQKLPQAEAIALLRQAMLAQDIMLDEQPTLIRIRPMSEAMQANLLRVPAEQRAADLPDSFQVVTKEFFIRHCAVAKMVSVVQPMLSGFGHILTDPDARKVVVTDSVANLVRIEKVVEGMDVATAEPTVTEIIVVEHGDAAEIISIVRWLIAGRMSIPVTEITTASGASGAGQSPGGSRNSPSPTPMGMNMPSGPRPGGTPGATTPTATQIEPNRTPVTLMPHISRNWIIVVAPADLLPQIRQWVNELDKPRDAEKEYELLEVRYADINDVARQIEQTLRAMPAAEVRDTTHVVPFGQSKKLIVFGSRSGRRIVTDLLAQLDGEDAEKRIRRTFQLQYANAEEMAERIESLFSNLEVTYKSTYYTSYSRTNDQARLTVVPDKRRNTVTVLTDSATIQEIEKLIEEEDRPIDIGDVKPKVYELQYADPGEIHSLLTEMFSGKDNSSRSFWDMYFGSSSTEVKPIGRLLGQFTFQVMASSNKLIVNSTSAANYQVIDELIAELDQPQRAGLPVIIELKYANAEDLCEQLNAMLAEPGTLASVRRADRGLADYRRYGDAGRTGQQPQNPQQEARAENADEMTFWWQSFRPPQDQVPSSNLIGRIRIVPVYRRNALMVLSPESYKEPVMEMIAELDQPGRQVMIRSRIGEIQHDGQTTLGLRIASDPSILGQADSAIGGSARAAYEGVFGSTLILNANANVAALLNMLIRDFGLRVMLEPTLTTSDNEASEYFDGQDVPVQTQVRQSAEGTSTVTDIKYEQVGTRIRVRPHITQNGNVDLMINLEVSRIVPGTSALGNFIFDRREVTTHVIVNSGQTIMLSGIIRQEDFEEVHKAPLLGDLPLIGKLFRSIDKGKSNREMVIFITPVVMSTSEEIDREMAEPLRVLDRVQESLDNYESFTDDCSCFPTRKDPAGGAPSVPDVEAAP